MFFFGNPLPFHDGGELGLDLSVALHNQPMLFKPAMRAMIQVGDGETAVRTGRSEAGTPVVGPLLLAGWG